MIDTNLSFERSVELFDQKLKALEEGNLTLEAALQAVDEASLYLRAAQERLEEARKRIEVRPLENPANGAEPANKPDDQVPF
jgi:exodeoxyribonuclease VII small subunit